MSGTTADTLIILGSIAGLAAFEVLGFRWWVRGRTPAGPARTWALVAILALGGGTVGGFAWWLDVAGAFAWDLPPLAGRMLGSAGWAFALVAFLGLQRPTEQRMRLVSLMLTVYLVPLALAIVLLHLDRFDLGAPISWAFFGVVGLLALGSAWCLVVRPRLLDPAQEPASIEPGRGVRAWLWLVAVIGGAWAVALALTDAGPTGLIWAWPGDPLTSRLIAAMLLTIAVAGAWSASRDDAARVTLGAVALYGLGLALAGLQNAAVGRPVPVGYVAAWGFAGAVSIALLWRGGGIPWRRLRPG